MASAVPLRETLTMRPGLKVEYGKDEAIVINARREVVRLVTSYENIVQGEQSCMLPYLSVPVYLDDQLIINRIFLVVPVLSKGTFREFCPKLSVISCIDLRFWFCQGI